MRRAARVAVRDVRPGAATRGTRFESIRSRARARARARRARRRRLARRVAVRHRYSRSPRGFYRARATTNAGDDARSNRHTQPRDDRLAARSTMEVADIAIKPVRDFAKDSVRLVKKCTKPSAEEFWKIASRTATGFVIMGFVGFFVKLVFIPINNIILSA